MGISVVIFQSVMVTIAVYSAYRYGRIKGIREGANKVLGEWKRYLRETEAHQQSDIWEGDGEE